MESNTLINPNTYKGFDIFKVFMSFLVVAIHVIPVPKDGQFINSLIQSILDCAVPYFFLVSGFLLAKKMDRYPENKEKVIVDFIKSSIKLYLIWTFIYLPITLAGLVINDELNIKSGLFVIKNIVFKGENFFSWPLWYLLTLVYFGISLLISFKLKFQPKYLFLSFYILFITLSIIFYKSSEHSVLYQFKKFLTYHFAGLRILYGLLIITSGFLLAKNTLKISSIILIIITIIFLLINSCFHNFLTFHFLGLATICLFLISKRIRMSHIKSTVVFRKTSTVMYLSHMIFYFIILYVLNLKTLDIALQYIIVVLSCLILSYFVIKVFKENTFINNLFP
ncbi:acyltransferase family protein [Sphingobacterium lactis]|uniref:acyltransferase family protein n=1 Tax=Sphingobacterium lactis TaxID=797291 RepID=UPI003F7CD627